MTLERQPIDKQQLPTTVSAEQAEVVPEEQVFVIRWLQQLTDYQAELPPHKDAALIDMMARQSSGGW